MSLQQSQIDALEHLLTAFLKRCETDNVVRMVFEDAHASLMGSNGPGGTSQKSAAVDYLNHMKQHFT
ncbi:hypothetical protein [Pseudomonas extremaustralis]|uniref:hypothetical protein n=1 Tax=Pseudomonas extremaustralis TaxID=359110 RepID=UPI002AA8C056|nr:hypothetical protein [Pseudomonas extremaustralis]